MNPDLHSFKEFRQGYWYNVEVTSAGADGSLHQAEVTIHVVGADGARTILLDGFLVPEIFSTDGLARRSGEAFAEKYIGNRLASFGAP